jgi:hypothetical protein
MQDLMDHCDSVHDTVDDVYDIDTDIDVILANVSSQQHVPGSWMPVPRWNKLSLDTQLIWDTISDSDKAIILGIGTSPLQRVCFHDIAGTAFEDNTAADSTNLTLVDADSLISSSGTTDPGYTVLAHASTTQKHTWTKPQGSDLPPSDICKVLSLVKRHEPGSTKHQDITIHSKTYHLVNVVSTYQISAAVHRSKHASLVDCGANGGIAGEDVRVIFKTLRSVKIQGLDNHQVFNIPIVTTGGVV